MSVQVYNDPLLLDYLKVCITLPKDERAQIEAFTGEKYDIDRAAIGNFMARGPKFVIKDQDEVLAVGGFVQQRPGVWRDYMLTGPKAWEQAYWFQITRVCRRAIDWMFTELKAHRVECLTPITRLDSRPEIERWYRLLGYEREGIRSGYCSDGSAAVSFAKVKYGNQ